MELERRGGGRLLVGGRGQVPIETNRAEPAVQILRKSAQVREEQEKCTHLEQVEHLKESLPISREQMEQG